MYVCTCLQDGQIDAEELQRCLTSSGFSGSYQPFSKETCRVMIAMLDHDYSGKMGFNEFKELWGALNQWRVGVYVLLRISTTVTHAHELPCTAASILLHGDLLPSSNIILKSPARLVYDSNQSCLPHKISYDKLYPVPLCVAIPTIMWGNLS